VHSPPCAPFSGARRVAKGDEAAFEQRIDDADVVVAMMEATRGRWEDDQLCPAVVLLENSPKILDKTGFAPDWGFAERLSAVLRAAVDAAEARGFPAARHDEVVMDPGKPASRRRWWAAVRLR